MSAAVALAKSKVEMLEEFFALPPVVSTEDSRLEKYVPYMLEESQFALMQNIIDAAKHTGLQNMQAEVNAQEDFKPVPMTWRPRSTEEIRRRSRQLRGASRRYQKVSTSDLPMSQHSSRVIDIIKNNRFCVIIGETGAGKTTQVPQIVLDDTIKSSEGGSCNIICTQPRRMAATSVAR